MSNTALHLVTGGTGFIGSALVHRLVRDGQRVRVLDNNWRGASSRLSDIAQRIEFVEADIRDDDAVREATRGAESIWHLASINGTEHFYAQPHLVLDVGVRGMLNVLHEKGVRNLFLASSSEVYQAATCVPADETVSLSIPDPLNPRYSYASAKIISEMLALHCAARRIERVIVFRPHNVYGPDMGSGHVIPQFILRMAGLAQGTRGRIDFPIEGTGRETRAFVYIDDLIEGLTCLRDRGRHRSIYHIGTDHQTPISELANEIARCFGREIRIVAGPAREGSVARRCPDISRLRALGYEPRVGLRDGLEKTVRWYRDNIDGYRDARRVA